MLSNPPIPSHTSATIPSHTTSPCWHGGGGSVPLPLVSSTAVVPGPPDVSLEPDDPPVVPPLVDPELVPPLDPPPLDPPPSDVVGTTPVSLELAEVVVRSSEVAPVIAPVAVPPPPGEPQEATAVHEHTPRTIERARIMARTIARPRVHDRASPWTSLTNCAKTAEERA